MPVALTLGRADHGRPLTAEEFEKAAYEPGFQYELIEGRLYVSPAPDFTHDYLHGWLLQQLQAYAREHSEVINYVSGRPRVFLPEQPEETRPEPDLAAYVNLPHHLRPRQVNWRDVSPLLVVEIISADDPDKDLVRNVRLYRAVPSIQEYWVIDPRGDEVQPLLIARRRGRRGWQRAVRVAGGQVYETPVLPGFRLVLDVHAGGAGG